MNANNSTSPIIGNAINKFSFLVSKEELPEIGDPATFYIIGEHADDKETYIWNSENNEYVKMIPYPTTTCMQYIQNPQMLTAPVDMSDHAYRQKVEKAKDSLNSLLCNIMKIPSGDNIRITAVDDFVDYLLEAAALKLDEQRKCKFY